VRLRALPGQRQGTLPLPQPDIAGLVDILPPLEWSRGEQLPADGLFV